MIELLAPAGNFEKLRIAIAYGADAVYLAGKNFGLRAFSENFDEAELVQAVRYAHSFGKKVYVTVNIFAYDDDIAALKSYAAFLQTANVDAVLVSDAGVFSVFRKYAPALPVHISTQANTTNSYAVDFWAELGAERIVLARELSLARIRAISERLHGRVELEAFVHGAMCMSYSGRCLLSNYLTGRPSNRGACAQSCRWAYALHETSRGEDYPIQEDGRGSYILNSKDMNMLPYIDKLADAGITSFKIEGRMKSVYYNACTVNAYRRALNLLQADGKPFVCPPVLAEELYKTSHRQYCTGFYFGEAEQCLQSSKPNQEYEMMALVLGKSDKVDGYVLEQRNRFCAGETLQVLTSGDYLNAELVVPELYDNEGNKVTDALRVQQRLHLPYTGKLQQYDILRKKVH